MLTVCFAIFALQGEFILTKHISKKFIALGGAIMGLVACCKRHRRQTYRTNEVGLDERKFRLKLFLRSLTTECLLTLLIQFEDAIFSDFPRCQATPKWIPEVSFQFLTKSNILEIDIWNRDSWGFKDSYSTPTQTSA